MSIANLKADIANWELKDKEHTNRIISLEATVKSLSFQIVKNMELIENLVSSLSSSTGEVPLGRLQAVEDYLSKLTETYRILDDQGSDVTFEPPE